MSDTYKTWREMTDDEKGALLLAYHEGKEIYYKSPGDFGFNYCMNPTWDDDCAYRIKPSPVVGEVVLTGKGAQEWIFGSGTFHVSSTHRLTLPTLDGDPVTGEFTGPDGHVIKVGGV